MLNIDYTLNRNDGELDSIALNKFRDTLIKIIHQHPEYSDRFGFSSVIDSAPFKITQVQTSPKSNP